MSFPAQPWAPPTLFPSTPLHAWTDEYMYTLWPHRLNKHPNVLRHELRAQRTRSHRRNAMFQRATQFSGPLTALFPVRAERKCFAYHQFITSPGHTTIHVAPIEYWTHTLLGEGLFGTDKLVQFTSKIWHRFWVRAVCFVTFGGTLSRCPHWRINLNI